MVNDAEQPPSGENSDGLTQAQAAKLLAKYGPNQIDPPKASWLKKIVRWLLSPMSLLLLAASALSFYSGRTFDGCFILVLFVVNFGITQWHEAKADQAIATLQKKLVVNIQAKRDGQWTLIKSDGLVPGDLIKLEVGSVVPADIQLTQIHNLSINESVLTGESLPKDKKVGQMAYTGSYLTTGQLTGVVQATGVRTKFGKTITLVDTKPKHSLLDRDILRISQYLMAISLVAVVVITILLIGHNQKTSDVLTLDLSLLIAGIPVAMPTVMSLIITLGVLQLTKKHVIVRRLSSLEDLANVNLLLSDKTGTLTNNQISVENIIGYGDAKEDSVLKWAISASTDNKLDPLSQAVINKARAEEQEPYKQLDFTPADSKRKRTTATVLADGKQHVVSLGAPQVIAKLCKLTEKQTEQFKKDVSQAANKGYRCLALAQSSGSKEHNLQLTGLLMLSDTLRPESADVIKFLNRNGIDVKMMTGDNQSIAERVARDLGMHGRVQAGQGQTANLQAAKLSDISVFAEVLPEDKFNIVKAAAQKFVVAATGDGVNDLPALKQASVGIAVKNAVDALKSSADIVLMTNGIQVIRDAIIESRKIFARAYYYSVYRISESFRLILSIAILSAWYGSFPLAPIQIILLVLLNDLPIITLAYDRVDIQTKPSVIRVKQRFVLASIYGLIGVATSLSLFYLIKSVWHLPGDVIQTMFFLKLAISGHMLIYVVHTKHAWWKQLPSKQIIWATSLTQLAATLLALSGFLFQRISLPQVALIWLWALAWMQVAELAKHLLVNRWGDNS